MNTFSIVVFLLSSLGAVVAFVFLLMGLVMKSLRDTISKSLIALVVMCVICVGSFVLCGVTAPESNNENSHSTMAVAMENDRLENASNRNEDTINNYNNTSDDKSGSERVESVPSTIPSTEEATTSSSGKKTYQSILDDYMQKIEEATPRLIEEYYEEAALNTNGLEGLAALSNDKVLELADICTDGVEEMAEVMWYTGSGSYSEYEEWAAKLYDVYMDEAGKITEAYMNSAQ